MEQDNEQTKEKFLAASAGVVSAMLFLASTWFVQGSVFLLFLPVLPLALYTLHYGIRSGVLAFVASLGGVALLLRFTDAVFLPC